MTCKANKLHARAQPRFSIFLLAGKHKELKEFSRPLLAKIAIINPVIITRKALTK
tara:strand:+ start:7295 stop:7459 length:165 start_codon:yes stop_codon:yes gene_type:complete